MSDLPPAQRHARWESLPDSVRAAASLHPVFRDLAIAYKSGALSRTEFVEQALDYALRHRDELPRVPPECRPVTTAYDE
ncbi:MAG: hypothetical protein JJU00_20085 [Opitutales bacterium]|nr:hypothetical protein [Opitutales bacterium]